VKRRLFTDLDAGARVVNIDDPRGAALAASLEDVWTVGRTGTAMVRAEERTPGGGFHDVPSLDARRRRRTHAPACGAYNVSNALVAAGSALALGIGFDAVVRGLESAPQVPGRLERIDEGQPFAVFVDYAHTPDSLAKAITAVREVTPGPGDHRVRLRWGPRPGEAPAHGQGGRGELGHRGGDERQP